MSGAVAEGKALLSAEEFAWEVWRLKWTPYVKQRTYQLLKTDRIKPHVIRRGRVYEIPAWLVGALRDGPAGGLKASDDER